MYIGNRDNPIGDLRRDRLSRETQVGGFADFVLGCETPMTISIQGSWGTGKTSFVNLVMEQIYAGPYKDDIIFVPFNSWQFVQFDMSEQLSSNLILAITKELEKKIPDELAKKSIRDVIDGMEILKATSRLGIKAANKYIKDKFDVDVKETIAETLADAGISDVSQVIRQPKEVETAIDTIKNLRKNLQKAINASLGITDEMLNDKAWEDVLKRKRVVFFVDDLDRLVPDKAVEVMEILKMFLDCEHCVFLLAIDYDAVVNGVTIKYQNAISEEKGHDFFEKMIQVVCTLPDTMNHTDNYISDILINNNQNISLAYDFADLVKKGGKDNPRAIKRLLNSYFLLDMMKQKFYAEKQSQTESVMQFAVLCLQAICPQVYDYLSAQFSGIYNYEKGVKWFNTLHKYVYEMSRLSYSTVEINEEKLAQWKLLRPDKKPDRVKLEFLCTFFDKMDSSVFAKECPGKQIRIQDVLGLQSAIMWTNLVQGRDDAHTHLDNIARIKISYGGFKTIQESTTQGTIEEAYYMTVVHILKLLYNEGIFDNTFFDMVKPMTAYQCELLNLEKHELLAEVIRVFHYILSYNEMPGWSKCVIGGREIYIKRDFNEIEEGKRLDVLVGITQLLSKYTRIGFVWYKDRRGKEILASGYDDAEGNVYVEEVSFISVNGLITQIPKRKVDKAYVETILQLLSSVSIEQYEECLVRFPQFLRDDGYYSDVEEDEDDPNECDDLEGNELYEIMEEMEHDVLEDMMMDDLDDITPVEYQDEYDRELLKYVLKENEDGWFDGEEPIDGWRNEQMILDGTQIGVGIYVGEDGDTAKMARNVYKLAKFLESDFIWYEDAYMKKVVHRGKDLSNHALDDMKNMILEDVYEMYPDLFETPSKIFMKDIVGFEIYTLEEE